MMVTSTILIVNTPLQGDIMHEYWGQESKSNLEKMYSCVDFTGKVVLDIGADWGGTPGFFLEKGAKRVIGVDGNKALVMKMYKHFEDDYRVLPLYMMIKHSHQLQSLLEIYRPDVVKLDCEGCEILLTEVPGLDACPEYILEVHSDDIRQLLTEKFHELGYPLATKLDLTEELFILHWRKS